MKRKVELKNSHQKQIINPVKCFKIVELLKKFRNIHYQFYDDYNIYTERCKKQDFKGYTIVFDEEYELIQDISKKNINSNPAKQSKNEIEEETIEELLENHYVKNDPIRKYQFDDYNKSCV